MKEIFIKGLYGYILKFIMTFEFINGLWGRVHEI